MSTTRAPNPDHQAPDGFQYFPPPLTAVEPGNGVYLYGASGKPTSSYNATNYFVDVDIVADTNPAQTLWGSSTVPAVPSASDTATVTPSATSRAVEMKIGPT